MYMTGNLIYVFYVVLMSLCNNIGMIKCNPLFVWGIPLKQVFWYGFKSGMYAGIAVVFKALAAYSYGPAFLLLQMLPLACGFFGTQYAVKSLFGAADLEEKSIRVWFFRLGISFLGAITGIFFAEICSKFLGV